MWRRPVVQHAAELDLPFMAIEEPEFARDPAAQFAAARARHPWLARTTHGYIATEYFAIRDLYGMDEKMRPPYASIVEQMSASGTHWGRFQVESVIALSGDDHKRIRDVLAPAFTPRAANQHRELMRRVIARVLDEWAPKGRFDFEEFASYFPITVMCELVGAPPEAVAGLRASLEALGLSMCMDPAFLPQLEQATLHMEDYLAQLIADRRAGRRPNAGPDLLDVLIETRDADGLSDAELRSLLILLFVAGYDTSKNVLTLIMFEMLSRPEMYARCASDPAYCHRLVEEALRYHAPGGGLRVTDVDLVYRDVLLPKDTLVFLPNGFAARDPLAAPDPDRFDPERPQDNRHLAFGRGAHMCLGQYIARAQIEEGLHQIAQRLRNPRLVGAYGFRPFPGVWGLKGLPIEFDPAPAEG
jgi:cytochrome P450